MDVKLLVNDHNVLHTPLGCWLALLHQYWHYYFEIQSRNLFKKDVNLRISFHHGQYATRIHQIYLLCDPQV